METAKFTMFQMYSSLVFVYMPSIAKYYPQCIMIMKMRKGLGISAKSSRFCKGRVREMHIAAAQ